MTAFNQKTFDAAWKRYVAQGVESHPPFASYLEPGASAADIAAAEKVVGVTFPPDLKRLLEVCNGSSSQQVLPGWEIFSAVRIAEEWSVWATLYHEQFKPEELDCEPEGPIRGDEWWRLKWVPFCGDGGGNHLCIDMEPAAGGTVGQVITMWHDEPGRELVAPSLTRFIEMIAKDFENGYLTWDEEWGGVYGAGEEDDDDVDVDPDGDED